MPERPLPDSRERRTQRVNERTLQVALGFLVLLLAVALLLFLLA